jgi:mono/diheme cytochrome c family protein
MLKRLLPPLLLTLPGLGLLFLPHPPGSGAQPPAGKQPAAKGLPSAEGAALFEKEVKPILEANCYRCHGNGKRRGGLSLASRAGLLKGGDTGPAVSLQQPEQSRLLKAINWQDGLEMPPKGKLPAQQLAVLTRWVKAGAPWPGSTAEVVTPGHKGLKVTAKDRDYWAYRPVKRPAVPAVKGRAWVRNPIDSFLLAGLEAKGLAPAPAAGRTALVRRVYYDVTGLPPTPEEIDAFVKDKAPDAYERLVDRLLQSPHYGEKWARHWLDIVRYAETNGFERDNAKPFAWRYRDYVVSAFNTDKPYDRFLREQLAGDLLEEGTPETLIATGYYRLGQWDDEPADRLQAKYDVLDGIVSTTAQAFLGMSVGCARCHDHKKDPIPQRDYYRLLAFFHNLTDMNGKNTRRLMTAEDRRVEEQLLREKQAREAEWERQIYRLEQSFAVALAEKKGLKLNTLPPSDLAGLTYRFYRDTWEKLPDFDALKHETAGPIAHNYFTLAPASRAEAIGLVFAGKLKVPEAGAYTFALESTDGARLLVDGKKVLDRPGKGRQTASAAVSLRAGLLPVRLEYFNTYGAPHLKLEWSGPGVPRRPLTEPPPKPGDRQGGPTLAFLIRRHGAEVRSEDEVRQYLGLVARLGRSRKTKVTGQGLEVMCVAQGGAVPTHVLIRGSPNAKGEPVEAGFPEVLSEPQTSAKQQPIPAATGRLALADWLADPRNPLTARVLANRLWQFHFGRGIVPTPNDFGKLGEAPTHPELLDWLASELVAGGWKLKRMHKLILTSSAYRMSAQADAKALRLDPANTLFWRFNMRRLTAEEVRDSILAASGRLNLKIGGPSVYPPIPKEVLAGQSVPGAGWRTSPPDEAARRSVYVHVKRSLQVPILAQFDQADTDSSCPVRFTTTVPTQSLGMLNGEFTNEQAGLLARRLLKDAPGGLEAQVRRAIRLTTGRVPSADEVRDDVAFVRQLQTRNRLAETEALRFYCLMLLNANEFVYLD